MPGKTILARYVKHFRRVHNESQEAFAYHCGLSGDFISLIECEKTNPSLETIQKIAAYTGATVAEIFAERDYADIDISETELPAKKHDEK